MQSLEQTAVGIFQQLMRPRASTAVILLASISCLQDGSSYSRHQAQSGQEERGRPEPAAAVPLYQKSKLPLQPPLKNSTQTLLARLDHMAALTCKGGWDGEQLVLLDSIVQANSGVEAEIEGRTTISGRVVLSHESAFSILLLFL